MNDSHHTMMLTKLTLVASALCLGLLLACGGTTENSHGDDPTDGGGGSGGDGGSSGDGGSGADGGAGGVGGNGGAGGIGGAPGDCPTLEPAGGSSCPLIDQVCSYANCVAPDYRDGHTLQCVEGAWLLVAELTCTAPEECPPYIYLGTYCSPTMSQGPCPYYDACGAVRDVYCTDNTWQYPGEGEDEDAAPPPDGGGGSGTGAAGATTSPPPPACPVYAPYPGQSCCPSDFPEYCDYSESGSDSAVATQSGFGAGPATGGGGIPPLTCAVCTSQMIWDACPEQ